MLSIRRATTDDIELIIDLAMQVWPQTYIPIIGAEQVAYMLGLFYNAEELRMQIAEAGHCFIIGYDEDKAVAFASYSETEPSIYKLHKLYLLPSIQGKGIGQYMIAQVIEDIKLKKATALRLNVNRYNHNAIAFYEKTGFSHLLDEDIDIGGGYFMNDHVLEMVLI